MKIKLTILCIASLSALNLDAANFAVSNLVNGNGSTDTLFQNAGALDAALLSGGIVTIGFFGSNDFVPSSDISMISTTISQFTIVTTGLTGGFSNQLGQPGTAGFVDELLFDGPQLFAPNPLIGRAVYLFAGNASTLDASTAFALTSVGVFQDETATPELQFSTNPTGTSPVIGQINRGAFTGDPFNLGEVSAFDTLQLTAVPEPSALLLSAFGALALLRRKR